MALQFTPQQGAPQDSGAPQVYDAAAKREELALKIGRASCRERG